MTTRAAQARNRSDTTLVGRVLLTVALVATPTALAVFLLSDDHAFSPQWHSHARFHGVQLAGFGITLSLLGLWLVWRKALEPTISALTAAAIIFLLWVAEFYAALVSGTGLAPDPQNPNTVDLFGAEVYGNLLFAGLMIVLSVIGFWLIRRSPQADPGHPS